VFCGHFWKLQNVFIVFCVLVNVFPDSSDFDGQGRADGGDSTDDGQKIQWWRGKECNHSAVIARLKNRVKILSIAFES
jgi:hypothetical protein